MKIKELSIEEVEYIGYRLAKEMMHWGEPIPDFKTRYPGVLEGCLRAPFQTFDGKILYKGLVEKAAIVFYLMIKNHPFQNGNKRIAVTTLIYFLYKNKKWLQVDNQRLYNFSRTIAQSDAQLKDSAVGMIKEFLKKNIADYK